LAAFSIFSESDVDTSDSEDDAFLELAMIVFGLPLDLDFPIEWRDEYPRTRLN
jgi:hypothetical protein